MPEHLLVATDMSERADRAIRRGFALAKDLDARLTLLTLVDGALPVAIAAQVQSESEARLKQFAASVAGSDAVNYEVQAKIGDPVHEITEAATDADLLILGIHRERPFMDALRETTMERLVRLQNTPVLLVRDPVDHPYDKLLSAMDFSQAATDALLLGAKIAPNARLQALHAVHIPYRGLAAGVESNRAALPFLRDAEQSLERWRDRTPLPEDRMDDVEIVQGSALQLLNQRIRENGISLLCVGAHGRVGRRPALLGSLTNDMIRTPPCDLLIAH